MTEIEKYLEEVKSFKEVTPADADELLTAQSGNIVYIGRETCPFCRRFVGKLSAVAKDENLTIHYVHSQKVETLKGVEALRNKYGVPTVPGFLYSDEDGVQVKCDSSMSPDDIKTFVKA